MDNRLFAFLIFLIAASFVVWMAHDWDQGVTLVSKAGLSHDLLSDPGSGAHVPLEYQFHFAEPVYSHDLATSQIEALARDGQGGERYHVYGLTQAGFTCGTHFEVGWSKRWFKDEYRVWVDDLRVEFEYNTLNVYVTSAYPADSCEYQATLAHENQHVAIHRQMFQKYGPIFQEEIGRSAGIPFESRPVTAASLEEGKEKVGEMLSAVTDPLFDRFRREVEEEQAKLDTEESYAALKDQCQHW